MKTSIAKIVGTPTSNSWAQTLAQGNLYLVIEVESKTEVASLGQKILVSVVRLCLTQEQNLASFKEALDEGTRELPEGARVNVVAVKRKDNAVYLAIKGGGKAFLKRGEVLLSVLRGEKDKIVGGSGFLRKQDLLIIATPQFEKLISQSELEESLDNFSPLEIAERLSPKIHESEEGSGVACIVLSFNGEESRQVGTRAIDFLRKNTLLVAIVLIIILLLSIILGVKGRSERQQGEDFKSKIKQVSAKYEEGKELLDLNRNLAYASFLGAQKILEEEKSKYKENSKEKKELEGWLVKVEELLQKSGRVYRVENPEVFFDLNLLREGARGSRLALLGEELAILDSQNNSLYSLSTKNKSSEVRGANFKNPTLVTVEAANFYVLDEEGVHKIEKRENKKSLVIKKEEIGEIVGLWGFLPNIYLLDKDSSTIHKYVPLDEGFTKRNYLASDIRPDFSKAISFAIDGAVYVLLSDGTILKYLQGAPKSFRTVNLALPFSSPVAIFTTSETNDIYILDKGNQRIVVLDKEGNYKAQYQWPASPQGGEGIKDVSDFMVSEKERKIFLLSGNKIYTIELKQ